MRYEIVAAVYRDLERASARLEMIDRLAGLFAEAPRVLLPTVALLCQGRIAPDFAGVEIGLAERLAARAVAQAADVPAERAIAVARETGDLGLAAERLLAAGSGSRPASLQVEVVFDTLHEIAAAGGSGSQGRKLALLAALLGRAMPLEARYLVRTVTGTLRLGIGTATILDALAQVHAGGRRARPVLEAPTTSAPTSGWSPRPWPTAGWLRWSGSRCARATRYGPCWPNGCPAPRRCSPSSAEAARPSTSTTASGCRPTAPPTGGWNCSPAAWNAWPGSFPTSWSCSTPPWGRAR